MTTRTLGVQAVQLPEQLIVDWISEDRRRWTWTPPAVPDFAGPKDLANVLVSYRKKLAEIRKEKGRHLECPGDLPDSLLEPLLIVAYQASFMTEESRPIRACLSAPSRSDYDVNEEGDGPLALAFRGISQALAREQQLRAEARTIHRLAEPLVLDDPKHIARFAPTLATDDAVLVVREQGEHLVCTGVSLLDIEDAENNLLGMPRSWGGEGLFVHIVRPGELRVTEGHCEYTLRANEIRIYRRACFVEPVSRWLEEVSESLVTACTKDSDWGSEDIEGVEDAYVDLIHLWSRVLREAVRMYHGGTIVVVPDVNTVPIKPKYPLHRFELGQELCKAWLSVRRVWRHISNERVVDLLEAKRCQIHRLCSASRSIGHLAATDGCVVIDRKLALYGFGGEITIQDVPPKLCVRVVGNTKREIPEADLLRPFGQRHKSAYSLCKQVPNSLAFVISQDGDLRVFASDESTVYLYDLLYP